MTDTFIVQKATAQRNNSNLSSVSMNQLHQTQSPTCKLLKELLAEVLFILNRS